MQPDCGRNVVSMRSGEIKRMADSSKPTIAQLLGSFGIVIVLIAAVGLPVLYQPWIDRKPWSRLDPTKLAKLTKGMPQTDVELLLGGPPGDYGNPELRSSPGLQTLEGLLPPKGSVLKQWIDDRNRFELYFDTSGHLVAWHERARFSRDYEPPKWRRKVREWTKL
jgi:hypothetical protein